MSFNIRERFRERKFSYKIKKQLDKKKENELEEKKNNSVNENPLKVIIFSPLIFTGFIKKVIDFFNEDNSIIDESKSDTNNSSVKSEISTISTVNSKNVVIDNNQFINDVSSRSKSTAIQNIKNISYNTFYKRKEKNIRNINDKSNVTGLKKHVNSVFHTSIKNDIVGTNDKKDVNDLHNFGVRKDNIISIDNNNSFILESKIFTKFKKILEKLDDEYQVIESETYLINKYSKDDELLKEAVIINDKIQNLLDRLNKVSLEFSIIEDEKIIQDPFLLEDSLLIDDIISYRELIFNSDFSVIPEKLKLLDEYNHLFINIDELENRISEIKDVKNKRVNELSKRDKNFNEAKIKVANLDEVEAHCASIIKEHDIYLDSIFNKVKKIDEKKLVSYKLKGFNGLLSSSLKYIGFLSLTPFRGIIPGIAIKTTATRRLISGMIKNIHYEKNERTIYSVHNYLTEIDNKIYDIDNVSKNIYNALNDVEKLKKEFKDYYFRYHLKEYEDVYKKIEKIEKDIIRSKNKVSIIRDELVKNKVLNKNVLIKVKKLNK